MSLLTVFVYNVPARSKTVNQKLKIMLIQKLDKSGIS